VCFGEGGEGVYPLVDYLEHRKCENGKFYLTVMYCDTYLPRQCVDIVPTFVMLASSLHLLHWSSSPKGMVKQVDVGTLEYHVQYGCIYTSIAH